MPHHSSSRRRRHHSRDSDDKRGESSVFNRISSSTSTRTRRIVVFLLGAWFGAMLLIVMLAPSTFRVADDMIWRKAESVTEIAKYADMAPVRKLMRDQASEVNRRMFDMWGWIQFAFASIVLGLLIFRSNATKLLLGLAGGSWVFAGLMNFVILPLISGNVSRERFQMLHAGFGVFQLAIALLMGIVLFLLFDKRQAADEIEKVNSTPPPELTADE